MSVDVNAMIEAHGDATLSHAGVKGMKWGVRRSEEQLDRARAANMVKGTSDRASLGTKGFTSGSSPTPGGGGSGDPDEEVQWDDLDDDEKEAWLEATLSSEEKLDFKTWVTNHRLKEGKTIDSKGNTTAPMQRTVNSTTKSIGPDLKSAVTNIAKTVDKTVDEVSEAVSGVFSDLLKKLQHGDISPDEAGELLTSLRHGELSTKDAGTFLESHGFRGLEPSSKSMAQALITNMQADDILAHYGVKGMRWGVRRSERQLSKAKAAADKLAARRGGDAGTLTTSGGRVHSSDSATASELKSIAKSYGSSALTNSDLQTLNTRMNLERQYSQLNPPEKTRLQKTLDGVKTASQVNKKLGNPAGKAVKAIVDKKTAGSGSKTANAAKAAAAAAAAGGKKKPKEKSSSNILSNLPKAGENLEVSFSNFDTPNSFTSSTDIKKNF